MNIALTVHDLHEHGGHSIYVRRLADALSRRHELTVFANRCERPANAQWKVSHVPAWRRNALATVATFPVGLQLKVHDLRQFTIRHAQGFCGGDPNVVTAHICVAAHLDSLRDVSIRTRLSLRMMAAAERRFYRGYSGHVIAVSQKVANELREFYGFRRPISVIHHGVDADAIKARLRNIDRFAIRSELGAHERQTLALYVGDLTKAHAYLRDLAARQPEVKFVIVTKSTRYHWAAANVKFVPATKDIVRYYAAADVFVFPTTYDAFGMVVLEAMAAGLPVFTSDRAGAAELISHGNDGLVFPLEQWADQTAEALFDRVMLSRIGNAARQTAQRHNWESVASKVEQTYLDVAAGIQHSAAGNFSIDEYRYQQS